MLFSETENLIYYNNERIKFPVVIKNEQVQFESDGEWFGVEYQVLTPLPKYYFSEIKTDDPRIIKIDDNDKRVRGMMHRARFGQVVQAILADCGTEKGVTRLKFGLAGVNDHEWVLGAMFEAGWKEKQLTKAEDGLLIVSGLSFKQEFGLRSDHYQDKHLFYAFVEEQPKNGEQVQELKERLRLLMKVSKMVLAGISGEIVGQDWRNNQVEYQFETMLPRWSDCEILPA